MKKLRLREGQEPAQGHEEMKGQKPRAEPGLGEPRQIWVATLPRVAWPELGGGWACSSGVDVGREALLSCS